MEILPKIFDSLKRRLISVIGPASTSSQSEVTVGGVTLPLETANPHEAAYLREPRGTVDFAVASKLNLEGKRVLDIGANIGLTALYYLEHGATCVDAVEPIAKLAGRIRRLNSPNIVVHQYAISDKSGVAEIHLSDRHNQGHSLSDQWPKLFPDVFSTGRREMIETTTLDKLFPEHQFDFVKIDVEGSEEKLVLGASDFFSRNSNCVVQIELYDQEFERVNPILMKFFANCRRIAHRNGEAFLVDPSSNAIETFLHDEVSPPNYIYASHLPPKMRQLD